MQARICPMARRCSHELEKCGGGCTGHGRLSASDAKADRSSLVDHVLLRAKKITPRASRQRLNDPSSPPSHSARYSPDVCGRIPSYGWQLGLGILRAGRWALPAGPCTTIVCLYLRLRDVQGLDSFRPISGTAAINITCKNATNHAVSKQLIHL